MIANVKRQLSAWAVKLWLRSLPNGGTAFDRILGEAAKLQLGRITEEDFHTRLAEFYSAISLPAIKAEIEFEARSSRLAAPGRYKENIVRTAGDPPWNSLRRRFSVRARRFGLLNRLGIDSDVLVLRQDATIPPHGHSRVVSGFLVLDGEVAVRHYDRVEDLGNALLVKNTIDGLYGPGGFTTNSEFHDNIHWLQGVAPVSFLFRLNVKGTPTRTFGSSTSSDSRMYVDPTSQADANGLIQASYVSEQAAKLLRMELRRDGLFIRP